MPTTLINGNFASATGWLQHGRISIAAHSATLREVVTEQSSLRQIFTVQPDNKFLRFTVSALDLHQAANTITGCHAGPSDAFEAALLHADTGTPLRAISGLTRCDAFLNLQAQGPARAADGLHASANSDGSTSYTLDLSDIPAGTTVVLSFDLLGFGDLDSHVTIRDVKLLESLNQAPVATDVIMATTEDSSIVIDVVANDADADGDKLTATVVAGPQHGQLNLNADGTFTYTPDANFFGTDSFTYKLSDGELESAAATVSITVTPVEDAPVASDGQVTTLEDTAVRINLRDLASDVDSPGLQTVIVSPPMHGTVVPNEDGTVLYTPHANYSGTDSFTFKVNDGDLDSNVATVHLTIDPVPDAPVASDTQVTTLEDTATLVNLLGLASDVDSPALTIVIVTPPANGTLRLNDDGTARYTPDANYSGTDSFSFKVNDGQLDSNVATVHITIDPVPDAPVANDAQVTTLEDTAIQINLRGLASDVDSPVLHTIIVTPPAHGTLLSNDDGTVLYAPDASYHGPDSFSFKVNDGELDSNVATVHLTIDPVPDAPVANDAQVTTPEDTAIQINLRGLASDVDSPVLHPIIVTPPMHGTLLPNDDGTVLYTPQPDYSGPDSFTFKVNDGQLDSNIATVQLTIDPVPDAPLLSVESHTDTYGATRDLFHTTWESVRNQSPTVTLVHQHELEGWTLVSSPKGQGGKDDHSFEVWSDGDRMHNLKGRPQTVHAAPGGGKNWIELNDSKGEGHQTLGIERTVATIAGASYTLRFDYAGRLGYDLDTTRIGIYLDDVKLASYANTSPDTQLDWHSVEYKLSGNGSSRTIRIATEATRIDAGGRGAMIGHIALTEALPIDSGFEGSPIRLSAIHAALRDTDGSEVLSVAITGLPDGSKLSDGSHDFTAMAGNGRADVTDWNLAGLSLLPPAGIAGTIHLGIEATATELRNNTSAGTTAALVVTVLPVHGSVALNAVCPHDA